MERTLVKVDGPSMAPYLVDGDHLLIELDKDVEVPGNLYLINCDDKLIVHRCLGDGRFKGDRVKQFDNEIYQSVEVVGRVMARMENENLFLMNSSLHGKISNWMAKLSRGNNWNSWIKAKLHVLGITLLGNILRYYEHYSASTHKN